MEKQNTEKKKKYGKIGNSVCPPPYNLKLKQTHKQEDACIDINAHAHTHTYHLEVIMMGMDMFEMERGQLCDIQIFRGWQVTGIRSPKHPGGCARRWSPGSCQQTTDSSFTH